MQHCDYSLTEIGGRKMGQCFPNRLDNHYQRVIYQVRDHSQRVMGQALTLDRSEACAVGGSERLDGVLQRRVLEHKKGIEQAAMAKCPLDFRQAEVSDAP